MLLIIRGNVYKKVYNGAVMNNLMNKMLAVQGQYLLGGCICLGTVEQTRQRLKVAVELFHSDKKLTYRNPIGLLQRVRNIVLKCLAGIKTKHCLKMKLDAVSEGGPLFGGSLGMRDTEDILPRCLRDLGLEDLFPWLSSLIRKKVWV